MNIIVSKPFPGLKQCTAIVGHFESQHILRYMRNRRGIRANLSLPFQQVARTRISDGTQEIIEIPPKLQEESWKHINQYFSIALPNAKENLKPIIHKMMQQQPQSANQALVVMTCNFGQVELLINFVCTAQTMDLSQVLVFCTDKDTLQIARGLGLNAYYDEVLFGDVPTEAAGAYGDDTFAQIMWAKIASVHLTIFLTNYDVLFQDVDVIWNQDFDVHPLDFFQKQQQQQSTNNPDPEGDFDLLFSDDGARTVRFAPYSANTGFYYVRNNNKTKWLFTSFVYISKDLLKMNRSHQELMTLLLSEHSMSYGLRVKVLTDHPSIMGGFDYHVNSRTLMKDIYVHGTKPKPMVFHMYWTHSYIQKIEFLKQMGMWQTDKMCVFGKKELFNAADGENLKNLCCAAQPIVECTYSDKPSIVSCVGSPKLTKGASDFWD